MNVLWCGRHRQVALVRWACPESDGFCNAVEMQLAPLDARIVGVEALVIEKVDGKWAEWALNALDARPYSSKSILDALAAAQTDLSLSNLSDIHPGQGSSEHSPQPERSSTEVSALALEDPSEAP